MKTASSVKRTTFNQTNPGFSAIIVAGGSGSRAGQGVSKQYRLFHGQPLLMHSLRTFLTHEACDFCIIVHPAGDENKIRNQIKQFIGDTSDRLKLTPGGADRQHSVLKGISALENAETTSDAVMIHDAARPGLEASTIDALLSALNIHDGAAPALPVTDALKRITGSRITTVDRTSLYRIQTPQAFRRSVMGIFQSADLSNAVDDFQVAETAGLHLTLVDGHDRLSKITYPEDFDRMETLMFQKQTETRTGLGYDVHAFEAGDTVHLCGVPIAHYARLKGHSDADVAWHALTDAILGALSEGDIGDHFPPSDEKWKGAASSTFLKFAGDRVKARAGRIINLDLTLICEEPKIKPHRDAMRRSTAELLGISLDRVSIKATTTEGLGFEGHKEGIASQAIASIELPAPSTDSSQ